MTDTEATLTPEDTAEFRARCRAFLEEHATGIEPEPGENRSKNSVAANRKFQGALAEAGLAGLTYPVEYGGQGLTKAHEKIWREEFAHFPDMTTQLTISHGMCLPMLAEFGTHEQKEQFLPDNIAAKTIWCQMFSEPGAGSDVASLQTKAELDGDEWTLNGQKVWTTLAHHSEYGIVVARTDPSKPKHKGISMFIVDMNAPGVEIRPIHQIDGGIHFNEVFFTDVRIPADWLVGEMNEGWRLAMSMLFYERVAIGTGSKSGVTTSTARRMIDVAKNSGTLEDPNLRQDIMRIYSEEFAKSVMSMRTRAEMKAGKTPGPGGSLSKLHGAKIATMSRSIMMELVGVGATAWTDGSGDDTLQGYVLSSYMANIAGGTDEIQKNIIGERVLGLPREPSVDKDLPFSELKVGTQTTT